MARLQLEGVLARPFARVKRPVLLLVFCTLLIASTAYLLVMGTAGHPSVPIELAYHLSLLICYGALWLLLADVLKDQRATPEKAFWNVLAVGAVCFGLAFAVLYLIPGGFHEGRPLSISTILKGFLLSGLQAVFYFVLLLFFRDLVLLRRTKKSIRNWNLMLASMTLAAALGVVDSMGNTETYNPSAYWVAGLVPATLCIAVNVLSISWIVRLSFRRKMKAIGFSVLLLLFLRLVVWLGQGVELPGSQDPVGLLPVQSDYLHTYSAALSTFMLLAGVFGVVYCIAVILSLVFHLPTTSDYQRRADEMAVMHSLTDLVNQVFDLDKLASTITESPVRAGSATAAWLAIADPETGSLAPRVLATHNIEQSLVTERVDTAALFREVRLTGKRLVLDQAMRDRRVSTASGDGVASLVVIPLIARSKVLGGLFVASNVPNGFQQDDVETITVFAAQAALALENARLFEEQVERERLSQELAIARQVQGKLLPQNLPSIGGLSLAASSVPAQEVGGDYYDFVKLDDGRLAFIVADVSGKGTSAAFYMAEMQGIFQSVTHLAAQPAEFLTHANRAISVLLERNTFISVIYGLFDPARKEIALARAGHCPAAAVSASGNARFLRSRGLGLGLDSGVLFRETLEIEHVSLGQGDIFVFYTDGVVESRDESGEEYGFDRLLASICRHRHEDAHDLHDAVLRDLDQFLGGNRQYGDDLTIVVFKWHGHGQSSPDKDRVTT